MPKIVAVEQGLTSVRQALEADGYRIVSLDRDHLDRAQAIVISGMDNNLMQQQDIVTDVPVINAVGRTADEVVDTLRQRLAH